MEKLPSRKAITELMVWMNQVKQQREDEPAVNSQSESSEVRSLLQKYKVNMRIEEEVSHPSNGYKPRPFSHAAAHLARTSRIQSYLLITPFQIPL